MKGKKLFSLIFTLPIISFALLYGGGYIAQFIENYKIWTSAGGTPGNGSSPEMPTFSIFDCFKSVFSFPYGIAGVGICILAIGLLIFMIMRMGFGDAGELDKDRNFVYSNKGTYGTAGFMNEKEINSLFDMLPASHPAKAPYSIYRQASDTVRTGVIIGLGSRLQVFQMRKICNMTAYDEIDLELPGKQPCAYYCITSDQDN